MTVVLVSGGRCASADDCHSPFSAHLLAELLDDKVLIVADDEQFPPPHEHTVPHEISHSEVDREQFVGDVEELGTLLGSHSRTQL
jgi:hypothetical protein